MPPTASRGTLRLALLVLPLLAVLAHSAPDSPPAGTGHRGILEELARIGTPRMVGPLLSIAPEHQPCAVRPPADGTIPRTVCPAADASPTADVLSLTARASEAVRAEVDPGALHAAALLDLVWGGDEGNSLQRSISYLQTAARLTDRPAPVLADLAATHLVRAERTQNARDLLEAVEAAEEAVELEPRNRAALFNRALALDRLGLDGEAAKGWKEFLMVDSRSGWATEARERVRAPATAPRTPSLPPAGAPAVEVAAYAARAPQEARLHGWDHLLGEWGAAVLEGDSARAEEKLRFAGALGDALERQGGDATLADAVRAIRSRSGDRAATRALARAHRAYAGGRSAFLMKDFDGARRSFGRVLAYVDGSSPLRSWAVLFDGAALLQQGHTAAAERVLRGVTADADTLRHPALAAHTRWARGTALLRSGRYEEGLDLFRTAAALFARAGEREHLGTVQVLAADAEYALGDPIATHASMHRALSTLSPYRGSVWLHNLLYIWAEAAAAQGYERAAVHVQNEGVTAATRTGSPIYVAESRLARARLLTATGETARAAEDVQASRVLVERLAPGPVREWLHADLRLAEAGASVNSDPARADAALDSVVAFFDGIGNPARLLPALVMRAETRLATGGAAAAEADLGRVVALLGELQASTGTASFRASLLEAARRSVDRLVMLRIAAGRPGDALAYLERGRASFAPAGSNRSVPAQKRLQAPPRHVALDYALVGDTLLTWTVADTAVHLVRKIIDRKRLTRTISRVRSAMELRADDDAVRPDLAALYDWLVRPVQPRLGPEGTPLLVVADGEIAGIPFAALYDSVRGRYLVEDHPLRFAGTLRDAALPHRARVGEANMVLLVADPAFDPRAYPGLGRLPGADAEARAVAKQYPHTRVLAGSRADRAALESALRQVSIAHYAGHAIFDDADPLRSHLVLAPSAGQGSGAGRLSAAEIERLDLRNLRLIVLSACQTSRAHGGRSGGFAGLAGALLAAGAGGVVGSLWRIEDEATHPLMVEFHRAYRRSGDAAGSLREAQLRLLHSPDPARRSPAAWAGFRYVGG